MRHLADADAEYALLVGVRMAGMVCGATAPAHRVPARLVAGAALVALAVQGAGMGVQTTWAILPVAFAGYLVGGVGHGVKNVLLRALIGVRVPEAVHGRAFAAYDAARNTAELAAVGTGGVLVTALGPRGALVLAGLGPIVAAAAGLILLRQLATPGLRSGVSSFGGHPRTGARAVRDTRRVRPGGRWRTPDAPVGLLVDVEPDE